MVTQFRILILGMLLTAVLSGCSGSGNPGFPGSTQLTHQNTNQQTSHYLWAYNLVHVRRSETGNIEVEVIPVRQSLGHWNVLFWTEQLPCTDCMKILGWSDSGNDSLLFEVQITHPFDSPNQTGFDVRGIPIFNGSFTFGESGLNTPSRAAGDGALLNADGYTTLYNITTMGSGPDGMQGYIKGKGATTIAPDAKLNGYKRHISAGDENTRNAFYVGDDVVATYEIAMPDNEFIFGYAIDANWAPPTVNPVVDPMTDFPPKANSSEPWQISVTEELIGPGLTDQGGQVILKIDIYDHQGKSSNFDPILECPGLFYGTLTATWVQDGDGFAQYEATIENNLLAPIGKYRCLISVEDELNAAAPAWLDLTAYQIHILSVTEGGPPNLPPTAVAAADPMIQVVSGQVHFYDNGSSDPDGSIVKYEWDWGNDGGFDEEGQDVYHSWDSSGMYAVQYRVTDDDGLTDILDIPLEIEITDTPVEMWGLSWGGNGEDSGYAVAVDGSGNAYVAGCFNGNVDLDPGDIIDEHNGPGVFLSKFDSSGNFLWGETWGATSYDSGNGFVDVAVYGSEGVYVTGTFNGPVDFDPGIDEDNHTTIGSYDVFLSKFDTSGNFEWAETWGGNSFDEGFGVAADTSGNAFVTGFYFTTVDFDPGVDVHNHSSIGGGDVFLSKFDSSGIFLWAETWGGNGGDDQGRSVAVDGSGNPYVAGSFFGAVDLDPGNTDETHVSLGSSDIYVSKFDSSGDFLYALTWGGSQLEWGNAVAVDNTGNLYVTGGFWSSMVDFDPGSGVDNHNTLGLADVFLSKFDSSGNFTWANTWGGSINNDIGMDVTADNAGTTYVTGCFNGTVDFDPGNGVNNHTAINPDGTFLSKFNSSGILGWAKTWEGGSDFENGYGVAIGSLGSVYVTGFFQGTVDFNPEGGGDNHTSNGLNDAFLSRFPSD